MSAATFTPGPWKLADAIGRNGIHVVVNRPQPFMYEYRTLAELPLFDDEDKANARLIAAAPDLLEACKLAFARLKPGDVRKDFAGHVAVAAMSKAIAKAEGSAD